MNIVLEATNIGKAYRNYSSEWQRIWSWFGIKNSPISEQWTLQNINFCISKGEALGIIGQNGAGKSTLLKIITGTLKSTTGKVQVSGKIAAILELGMGFHPDMTGRQNAYHAAGLMGYSQEQIDSVIDEIEIFAEIGTYFDMPVRLYSSGMQVRVAFAVATAFRPEILIIDEALSVGDAYFQHKSFNRIRQFRNEGTSLIFVSHDKSAILALCDRVILLDNGKIIQDGLPEEVTDYYNALIAEKDQSTIFQERKNDGKVVTISGTKEATVENIELLNTKGEHVEYINVGDDVELRIKVGVHHDLNSLVLGYAIKDRLGQVIFGTNTWHTHQVIEYPLKQTTYIYSIKFTANFGVGHYSVVTALTDKETHLTANYEWRDLALIFTVVNTSEIYFNGLLWCKPTIGIIQ